MIISEERQTGHRDQRFQGAFTHSGLGRRRFKIGGGPPRMDLEFPALPQ